MVSLDKDQRFAEFGSGLLDSRISKAIAKLGYVHPTLIQSKFIPLALKGKDMLARARTGSGKTIAYAVPVLQKVLMAKESMADDSDRALRAVVLVPSKELCTQTHHAFQQLMYYCSDVVSICSLAGEKMGVQKMELKQLPDILITTPGRLVAHLHAKNVTLKPTVETLVIDEADMVLSFGHKGDLSKIIAELPSICQTFLMSATLSPELDDFRQVILHKPAILKLEEGATDGTLAQFFVEVGKDDKDVLLYALLKLGLISGRILFFVNDINECYRLKLLLEQYVVRSAVLNAELPAASRQSILDQFNKGVFDHLIAIDSALDPDADSDDDSEEEASDDESAAEDGSKKAEGKSAKTQEKSKASAHGGEDNGEFGVARGIDFKNVTTVINFDFPSDARSYTHRIGRTARGGASGTALTLVCTDSPREVELLKEIQSSQPQQDGISQPQRLPLDMAELEPMRYRVSDVRRAVTRVAVREARLKEIKQELLNCEKLQTHFKANPHDAAVLHDEHLRPTSIKRHMASLPSYLIPAALQGDNTNNSSGKGARPKRRKGGRKRKTDDPLQSFAFSVETLDRAQKGKKGVAKAEVIARMDQTGASTAGRRKWKEAHDKKLKRKQRQKKHKNRK